MKLESVGILVNIRPFNERDSIARIFTYDHGVLCGMMRGAVVAKKNRPLVGQYGNVAWNARLDSQLGVFHWDAERNLAAILMTSAERLGYMTAAFDLISTMLPERARYEMLFSETISLLRDLNLTSVPAAAYLEWEIKLLRELGYALDLTHCSGCGATHNLNYLSPRTGRAVCDECAAPYIDKIYKLPLTLNTTLRFLDAVCAQQGISVPQSRRMLGHI